MKLEYSGTQGQIGDKYCWDSKNDDAGVGCQEITELIPNKKQKTRILLSIFSQWSTRIIVKKNYYHWWTKF